MKLGDLFIDIITRGNAKELEKANKELEKADKIQQKSAQTTQKKSKAEKNANAQTTQDLRKLSGVVKGLSGGIKGVGSALSSAGGLVGAVGAVVSAVTVAYMAVDRMVTSLSQANQQMISFQRQTGISFTSLNKYASASATANFNASIEGTAQSMQRVLQNVRNIEIGRGDVSPFQELAFFGGKSFNPQGMSIEEIIENVREGIKGIDDIRATDIITRMGFSPDDLLMLRMSREEFEQINSLFLDPKSREALYEYSLELKKAKLAMSLAFQKTQLQLIKEYGKGFLELLNLVEKLTVAYNNFRNFVTQDNLFGNLIKTQFAPLRALFLIIDDIATYMAGGNSVIGEIIKGISSFANSVGEALENSKIAPFFEAIKKGIESLATLRLPSWLEKFFDFASKWMPFSPFGIMGNVGNALAPTNPNSLSYGGNNINTNNSFSITTQQPMDVVADNLINRFTPVQAQFNVVST